MVDSSKVSSQKRAIDDIISYLGLSEDDFSLEHFISLWPNELNGVIGNRINYKIQPILNSNQAVISLKTKEKLVVLYVEFSNKNSLIIHGYTMSNAKKL